MSTIKQYHVNAIHVTYNYACMDNSSLLLFEQIMSALDRIENDRMLTLNYCNTSSKLKSSYYMLLF